jgi:hypothetical protein
MKTKSPPGITSKGKVGLDPTFVSFVIKMLNQYNISSYSVVSHARFGIRSLLIFTYPQSGMAATLFDSLAHWTSHEHNYKLLPLLINWFIWLARNKFDLRK